MENGRDFPNQKSQSYPNPETESIFAPENGMVGRLISFLLGARPGLNFQGL